MIVIRFHENDNKEEWDIRFDKLKDPIKKWVNDIILICMPIRKKYELYKKLENIRKDEKNDPAHI